MPVSINIREVLEWGLFNEYTSRVNEFKKS